MEVEFVRKTKSLEIYGKDLAMTLRKRKRLNLLDNLRYIDLYVEYIKKTPNKEWSRRQNKFINSIYRSIPKRIKIRS
ncbi:MAG: hypothetical protein RXO35_02060 [Candidatus Micrarchaeota archaeon]